MEGTLWAEGNTEIISHQYTGSNQSKVPIIDKNTQTRSLILMKHASLMIIKWSNYIKTRIVCLVKYLLVFCYI